MWIILTLLIPVINESLPFNGWNKYLLCVNLMFISLPLMAYIKMEFFCAFFVIGFLVALVLLFKSNATEPPILYKVSTQLPMVMFTIITIIFAFYYNTSKITDMQKTICSICFSSCFEY